MHRINHMQMTFPIGTMTDEWIADLRAFYTDIFGWRITKSKPSDEHAELKIPSHIYMYLEDGGQQYLVLNEDANPMQVNGSEHLGIITERAEEVEELLEKCQRFADKDPRAQVSAVVRNLDAGTAAFDDGWRAPYIITGFNVRYLMPVSWDIGHDTYKPGQAPPKRWQYA